MTQLTMDSPITSTFLDTGNNNNNCRIYISDWVMTVFPFFTIILIMHNIRGGISRKYQEAFYLMGYIPVFVIFIYKDD